VVSDSEITVTAPDANAAADGKSILESQITASFTDSEDSNATVTSLSVLRTTLTTPSAPR